MLQLSGSISNIAIMSLRTGYKVGIATRPIINPDNLNIEGWHCYDIYNKNQLILPVSEIREIVPQGIAVNDHESMTDPDELIRLSHVIDLDYQVIGKVVFTNRRRKIGRLDDYAIDSDSFKIQKLYVSRPLYKSLANGHISIDRSQVIEVNNKRIIIKDLDLKASDKPSIKLLELRQNTLAHDAITTEE